MRFDPYRNYIESLEASEPNPPFSEIRELVFQHNSSKRMMPFYRLAAGAILGALMVGFGAHFVGTNTVLDSRASVPKAVSTQVSMATATINSSPGVVSLNHPLLKKEGAGGWLSSQQINHPQPPPSLGGDYLNALRMTKAVVISPVQLIHSSNCTAALYSIALPATSSSMEQWSAFIAVNPVITSGGAASFSQLMGAVGVQYKLSENSSIIFEARQTNFQSIHNGQTGGLRDTMLAIGGQTYRSTIGGNSTSPSSETAHITSLDAGYRFVMYPETIISPTAELLAGASTSGIYASEALGIDYRLNAMLALDVSAREAQLYARGSALLNAFSFEAGIGFVW